MSSDALKRAITLAGSEEKLGKAIGYSQHAVWKAKKRGSVSAEMAVAIDRWSAGAVPAVELRPDLYAPRAAA